LLEINRDPCRTPMQWTGGPGTGFSPIGPEGNVPEPWLPIHPNHGYLNVEHQRSDPLSIYNLYLQLLRIRRETSALNRGSYRSIESPADTFVYLREFEGENRMIALNFSDLPRTIPIPDVVAGRVLISTRLDREGETVPRDGLVLRGHEGCLLS
jgi:alpha-glucosidase